MSLYTLNFIIFYIIFFLLLNYTQLNKKMIFLFANMLFYVYAGLNGFIFLIIYTFLVWCFGKIVNKIKFNRFIIAVFLILLPLIIIKYLSYMYSMLQINFNLNLYAPLGISFYSFQSVSYLVDIYNNKATEQYSYVDFLIYCSMFTYVTSGPINRNDVLNQIKNIEKRENNYTNIIHGFRYILFGLFLKLFISERMGLLVNGVYNSMYNQNGLALLLSSVCYSIQIYSDFCGYSYIAYGLSKTVGLSVIQNFCTPYRSYSLKEFWSRWHISLSTWLRDYVYIPLGGSRCTSIKKYRNLVLTFAISGLWHGASINYLLWGVLHGVFSCIEKKFVIFNKLNYVLKRVLLLLFLNWTWIIFRLSSMSDVIYVTKKIIIDTGSSFMQLLSINGIINFIYQLNISVPNFLTLVFAAICFLLFEHVNRNNRLCNTLDSISRKKRYTFYFCIILIILIFGVTGQPGEFIYANY